MVYIDEFASRQAERSKNQGRVADFALKHYIGGIIKDILVIHKICSSKGATNLFKLNALIRGGPCKTITVFSSLGNIVFVWQSKLPHLYDDNQGGSSGMT